VPEGDNSLLCICPVSLVSIAASRYAQAAGTVSADALERERRAPHVEHKVGSDAAVEHRIQAVHFRLVGVIEQQRRQVLLWRRSHAPAERAVQQRVKALCALVELLSAEITLNALLLGVACSITVSGRVAHSRRTPHRCAVAHSAGPLSLGVQTAKQLRPMPKPCLRYLKRLLLQVNNKEVGAKAGQGGHQRGLPRRAHAAHRSAHVPAAAEAPEALAPSPLPPFCCCSAVTAEAP